jgi:hypothetical protein
MRRVNIAAEHIPSKQWPWVATTTRRAGDAAVDMSPR